MRVNIVHMFEDEKFFDSVSEFFDSLSGVNNRYYYYKSKHDSFTYIKQSSKITIFKSEKEYLKAFTQPDIDIVYLHSLSPRFYKYILCIPKKVKIIWWAWGYDLYYKWRCCREFIPLTLYKEQTKKLFNTSSNKANVFRRALKKLYCYLTYIPCVLVRNKVLARIDYFSPVLPVEYHLMSFNKYFRAEPFMLRRGPGSDTVANEPIIHLISGNILVGNSLTLTNNHLDIWDKIKHCTRLPNQSYVFPVNYGNEVNLSNLKENIQGENIIWLEKFMPLNEYTKLQKSISHAVFGVIRQQAMGNIFDCLRNGVKVFLFKDSLVYKYLKEEGYIVYCIEDMSEESFLEPLKREDALHNYMKESIRSSNNKEYAESELLQIVSNMRKI